MFCSERTDISKDITIKIKVFNLSIERFKTNMTKMGTCPKPWSDANT